MKRFLAKMLSLALLLSLLCIPGYAVGELESLRMEVKLSSPITRVGDTLTVTLALTGYSDGANSIQALQIDVDNVLPSILEVRSCESLIPKGDGAMSNTAVHQSAKKRLRLIYAQKDDTLPSPCTDVFQFQLRVNPELTEAGKIALPITVKMGTTKKTRTLTASCVIDYSPSAPSTTSVDIDWGGLNYTFTDGLWDPSTHRYGAGSWTDDGSGYVMLTNNGSDAATAKISFESTRPEITGHFTDSSNHIIPTVTIPANQKKTVYLQLAGKPSEALNSASIGTVTVQIGGE